MAKPIKHGNNWRVRPLDYKGERQSFIFSNHTDALSFLKQYEASADEKIWNEYADHRGHGKVNRG